VPPAAFSEFTFAFAFTYELVGKHGGPSGLGGLPVIPSLTEEAKVGYDLGVPVSGVLYFAQFKVPFLLSRSNAREWYLFNSEYLRISLMPERYSPQHQILLDLELSSAVDIVEYVAPEFTSVQDLTAHFVAATIEDNCAYIRPSDIGALPDPDDHYLSYVPGASYVWYTSDPRLIYLDRSPESRSDPLLRLEARQVPRASLDQEVLVQRARTMDDIVRSRSEGRLRIERLESLTQNSIEERPLEWMADVSRLVLGGQLVLLVD